VLNLIRRSFTALYLVAMVAAGAALVSLPGPVSAQTTSPCRIECERCRCDLRVGICDCTKCVLVGCRT
jgi:hypothetical protein